MNLSELGNLNLQDIAKGAVVAILGAAIFAFLTCLQGVFQAPDFNVFSADWHTILVSAVNNAVNAGAIAFVSYLAKNLLSDSSGKVLGKI